MKKERKGIIDRIIRFLLGIEDSLEQKSLATYIGNAKNFDQLKDFDKNLKDTVNQTRNEVHSIFSNKYAHREERLGYYTKKWEAEQLCKELEEKIRETANDDVKKTLERELKVALKNYRDMSGKHRYFLLTKNRQLKIINKNRRKTDEHISKQEKALEVLNKIVDEVSTEVAGRRAQNNQLLKGFRSR